MANIYHKLLQLRKEIRGFTQKELEDLKRELRIIRDRIIDEAVFPERLDLMAKLGVHIYPSEDLKSRRIRCHLSNDNTKGEQVGIKKDVSGRPYRSRTCDTLIRSLGIVFRL